LSQTLADSLARERFGAILVSLFGVLALVLTAVGVCSTLAQAVRIRRREIGIRMPVGASGDGVLRLVVRRGLLPIAIGVGAGTGVRWPCQAWRPTSGALRAPAPRRSA